MDGPRKLIRALSVGQGTANPEGQLSSLFSALRTARSSQNILAGDQTLRPTSGTPRGVELNMNYLMNSSTTTVE